MTRVTSSAPASVYLQKHVVAHIRVATTNQDSSSGMMKLAIACASVI